MKRFFHHSRLIRYRSPQGAVPCGSVVHISALLGDSEQLAEVFLNVLTSDGYNMLPMQISGDMAHCELHMPEEPGLVWYSFILKYPDGINEFYGGDSGEGQYYPENPHFFRITVYNSSFETPDWFKGAVCYQIFPDRFRRSSWEDFHNRLRTHRTIGEHPRIHERWSDEPLTSPPTGEEDYEPNDFFGGDLNGITDKLDYLASFGVTCIYLNPIFSSSSNHRYNTTDYMRIDPILGSEEDFRRLCSEARKRGIRIMLDGVFSHTGSDSVYFNRDGFYGETSGAYRDPSSRYRDWYQFKDDGTYSCWWGFESLPEVNELTPSYVDFIAGENGVLKKWADCGATDWRLDVADELPDEFIRILRKAIKKNDPQGMILGEVWEDPTSKTGPEGRRGYVNGDELDSVMNYGFSDSVISFLSGESNAYQLSHFLHFQREQFPEPFYQCALNLLGSHDVPRVSTAFAGAPKRGTLSREEEAAYHPAPEKAQYGRNCMPLGAALQIAVPGVPCLYYGDEAGLTGMSDPFNRKTYPWGKEDMELLDSMRRIFSSRSKCTALRTGKCRMGAVSDDVFCVIRYTEDSCAIVCINRGNNTQTVQIGPESFSEGPDGSDAIPLSGTYITEGERTVFTNTQIQFTVSPLSVKMYLREGSK